MHILARAYGSLEVGGARAFRPLQSSHYETIHLSCYNLDICKDNYFFSSVFLLTPRVVDPLSPTVADSIMISVCDLNHYGIGLFDFCVRYIGFLARLSARSEKATINSSYKIQTYVFYIKKPEIRFLSITIHLSPSFLRKNSYS